MLRDWVFEYDIIFKLNDTLNIKLKLPLVCAIGYLFLTRQRMTQRASWMDRSASSITSLLEPRTTILTVFPGFTQPVIYKHKQHTAVIIQHGENENTWISALSTCVYRLVFNQVWVLFLILYAWKIKHVQLEINWVTFTSLPDPSRLTSSASSAVPSISGVNWSIWAIGLVPIVWWGRRGMSTSECVY